MIRFIKFIKNDFNNVKGAIYLLLGRRIPLGIIMLYYILVAPLCLLLYPFVKVWSMIILRKCLKEIEEELKGAIKEFMGV